jgi:putative membrane protein
VYVVRNLSVGAALRNNWATVVGIVVAVACVTALQINVLHLGPPTLSVSVLGIAISFFIGFVNSIAYRRWRGAMDVWVDLSSKSRSFSRVVFTYFPDSEQVLRCGLIHRHIGFLYALRDELREVATDAWSTYLDSELVRRLQSCADKPTALLESQAEVVQKAAEEDLITGLQSMQLHRMLAGLTDAMGRAQGVKRTAFPAQYTSMLHLALWVFVLAFPLAASAASGYGAILYGSVLGTVLVLTFRAGESLLYPFENRPTDVPMSAITRTIEIKLLERLGADEIPPELEPTDGLYLM